MRRQRGEPACTPAALPRVRVDGVAVALLTLVLLINLPYLARAFVPSHDTADAFYVFYAFYTEWVFHQQLPHWLPFETYGTLSNFQQVAFLTPVNYVVMVAGGLLRIRDALGLFKLSVLMEQFVFVAGLYRLCRLLYAQMTTAVIVCLGAIGGLVWHTQILYNFHLYYLLPLELALLFSFFATQQPLFFWGAGLVGMAWLLGVQPYYAPVWLYTLGVLTVLLGWGNRSRWRCLCSHAWTNVVPMALLVIVAGTYLLHLCQVMGFHVLQTGTRTPHTGAVNVAAFLYHGGHVGLTGLLRHLLLAWPAHLPVGSSVDTNAYVGLAGLVFFVWSLLKVRSRPFLAIVATLAALYWLSLGGIWSTLMYYTVPLMGYYQHLGLLWGMLKVFLLLCVGFGWEACWAASGHGRFVVLWCVGAMLTADLFGVVDAFVFKEALAYLRGPLETLLSRLAAGWEANVRAAWVTAGMLRVGCYGALIGLAALAAGWLRGARARRSARGAALNRGAWLKGAVLLGLLADLALYQFQLYGDAPRRWPAQAPELRTVEIHVPAFQDRRAEAPLTSRQEEALRLITSVRQPLPKSIFSRAYSFAQFDPCVPAFETHFRPVGVVRLLAARPEADPVLRSVLGCETSKLRLVPQAVVADTLQEAEERLRTLEDPDQVVVLQRAGLNAPATPSSRLGARQAGGAVRVTGFTANELTVEVDGVSADGAWLVYADTFHPGWRATVNERPAVVAEANLAFKAVRVEEGRSIVRFAFHDVGAMWRAYLLAGFGAVMGVVLLGLVVRTVVPARR